MAGWRVHGPEKDGNNRMERQSKGSRGQGQGPPRAVALPKKKYVGLQTMKTSLLHHLVYSLCTCNYLFRSVIFSLFVQIVLCSKIPSVTNSFSPLLSSLLGFNDVQYNCGLHSFCAHLHKSSWPVCLSVHLFACISAATSGRIYVKSDIRDFYGKSVEKIQIWLKSKT